MDFGQPIASGNTADLYLLGNRIVKVFREGLPDGRAENEAAKQRAAHASGLPVPEIYDVCRVHGRQAIVMEYVSGETLGDIMRQSPERAAACLGLSIDLQLAMHAKAATGLEKMRGKLTRQLRDAALPDEDIRAHLLGQLAAFPMESNLCHGDFHAFNLIQTHTRTVIIDWMDASAGSPRADACRSYLLYAEHAPALAEAYLDLYCEKSGIPRADVLAWLPVIAGARLSERLPGEASARLLAIVRGHG